MSELKEARDLIMNHKSEKRSEDSQRPSAASCSNATALAAVKDALAKAITAQGKCTPGTREHEYWEGRVDSYARVANLLAELHPDCI